METTVSENILTSQSIDEVAIQKQIPAVRPQGCGCGGDSSMAQPEMPNSARKPQPIYAIGEISHVFPNESVEKEFAQAAGRQLKPFELYDPSVIKEILKRNRYLAHELTWKLNIRGIDAYILEPKHSDILDLLVESLRGEDHDRKIVDIVIGESFGLSDPSETSGLLLPVVVVDQIYSDDSEAVIKEVPKAASIKTEEKEYRNTVRFVHRKLMQMADNMGSTPEHRALNYLAVRYHRIYEEAAILLATKDFTLSEVNTIPSRLGVNEAIVDVVLSFTNSTGGVNKLFVRVNVSGKWPFIVTQVQPYYDR